MQQTIARTAALGERQVAYTLRISDRARHVRLCVGAGGLVVVLPRRAEAAQAEQVLHRHADWVLAKLDLYAQRARAHPRAALPPNTLLLRGRAVRWELTPGRLFAGLGAGPEPVLRVPATRGGPGAWLRGWLRRQARQEIESRVAARAAEMGVRPTRLTLRDQRTRWASCSRSGSLSFNWRLIMAPPEVLDYVVIHELAHLREMNHSPRYWRLVARHCPDHRAHRQWLRAHQELLHGGVADGRR